LLRVRRRFIFRWVVLALSGLIARMTSVMMAKGERYKQPVALAA
jgi:hypothetical protein